MTFNDSDEDVEHVATFGGKMDGQTFVHTFEFDELGVVNVLVIVGDVSFVINVSGVLVGVLLEAVTGVVVSVLLNNCNEATICGTTSLRGVVCPFSPINSIAVFSSIAPTIYCYSNI